MKQGSGIEICEEAFERLVNGRPNVPEHVGIEPSKITAGIVSVEAGFDRGYLKKGRKSHIPLIARIEVHRGESLASGSSLRERTKRAEAKAQNATDKMTDMQSTMDIVLTQNLLLVERIKELESELNKLHTLGCQ